MRSKITVIPQDPSLFTGSLRFNIDPLDDYTDDEILSLLKKAGLDDLVQRSDGSTSGLNMKIAEGGSNLSAG